MLNGAPFADIAFPLIDTQLSKPWKTKTKSGIGVS